MGTSVPTRPAIGPLQGELVATKLNAPAARAGSVTRAELVARLGSAEARKLTLVCAPAGWGKSVLLSQWRESCEGRPPFAWVSLDRGDDDPVRFWAYVIGALRTIEPKLGTRALAARPGPGANLGDAVVGPLINELAETPGRIVLVLDDYHVLHSESIHASVAFLLRHLPHSLHLALATRADPPLALGALRAAGEVMEIRAADLSFSDVEADELLNGSLALGLEQGEVAALRTRTEGWAAGLQLAALSLQAHPDRRAFIATLTGDDRQIGEYLHEVLADQSPALREFLLDTSVLERLCAPLCDAVTGSRGAAQQLEAVERANLFLVSLDTRREWYRYHHLFRELLRRQLERADPERVAKLHRRAAAWHRAAGNLEEAIRHATAAGDLDDAAELIAANWRAYFNGGQTETVARWIDALPRDYVVSDARLCLARGWVALYLGRLDEGEALIRDAQAARLPGPFHDGSTSLEANVAFLESLRAALGGDVGASVHAARRALALQGDADAPERAALRVILGRSLYHAGELGAALTTLADAVDWLSREAASVASLAAVGGLALAQVDSGDPLGAERSTAVAERLVVELAVGESAWAALPLLARGKLRELGGDLVGAQAAYRRAALLAARGARRLDHAHALLLDARLARRRGEPVEARSLARESRAVLDACADPGMLRELLARTERSLQLPGAPASGPVLPSDLDLSERELSVLRLLATELSQREIGGQLYITVNTVKGHVRSIFRKLGVESRSAAVDRAREVGLL